MTKFSLIPIFFFVVLSIVLIFRIGHIIGEQNEKTRIYERCLTQNSTLVYNDADNHCKKVVEYGN